MKLIENICRVSQWSLILLQYIMYNIQTCSTQQFVSSVVGWNSDSFTWKFRLVLSGLENIMAMTPKYTVLFKCVMVQTGNPAGVLSDLIHKANKLRLWALGLVLYLVQAVESSSDSGLLLLVARFVIWFVKMLTQWWGSCLNNRIRSSVWVVCPCLNHCQTYN